MTEQPDFERKLDWSYSFENIDILLSDPTKAKAPANRSE